MPWSHVEICTIPKRILDMLPTDSKARKDIPLARGCYDYFPLALAAVAKLSQRGNDKHNKGQPLHWSRDKSTDHADCIARHQVQRGTYDADNDCLHDVAVAWRALAQAELALEKSAKLFAQSRWTLVVGDRRKRQRRAVGTGTKTYMLRRDGEDRRKPVPLPSDTPLNPVHDFGQH